MQYALFDISHPPPKKAAAKFKKRNNRKKSNFIGMQYNLFEEWKDIKGYEGKYQISNMGRVKSLKREAWAKWGIKIIKERIKKTSIKNGYTAITLNNNGIKTFRIHQLVATYFIENTDKKQQVNHINGIKTDNRADNLEWVTPSENIKHAYKLGLKKPNYINNNNRKVYEIDVNNNILKKFSSISQAERFYKINRDCIGRVCKGISKTTKGKIFRYAD